MMDDDRYRPRNPGWRDDWGGWGMHDGMGWGGWLFMILFVLLVVALVAALVMVLVRSTGPAGGAAPGAGVGAGPDATRGPSVAESLLDERFARGEIDEEEYRRRRSVLRGG